jgi:hypothetical protein
VCGGCSKSETPAKAPGTTPPPKIAATLNEPAALAAHGFLTALIKGDTQAATQHLTPQAVQQFANSGQRFTALGPETMQFRLGEMRKVSDTQALVQCILVDKQADETPQEQEICCVVKSVDGQWRVSGIVVDLPGNTQPIVLDFERPEQPPQASQPSQNFVQQPPAGATTTSVRTAQELPAPPQR